MTHETFLFTPTQHTQAYASMIRRYRTTGGHIGNTQMYIVSPHPANSSTRVRIPYVDGVPAVGDFIQERGDNINSLSRLLTPRVTASDNSLHVFDDAQFDRMTRNSGVFTRVFIKAVRGLGGDLTSPLLRMLHIVMPVSQSPESISDPGALLLVTCDAVTGRYDVSTV